MSIDSKKRLKLAEIRKNDKSPCPFGLPIPFGCKHAGDNISKMAPLKSMDKATQEEKDMISEANTKLLGINLLHGTSEPGRCPYAAKVFDDHDAVECNYEDSAPGVNPQDGLKAAPFFPSIFSGVGLHGLLSYPIGYYADYNTSRNLYYGIFSLQGSKNKGLVAVSDNKPRTKKAYANKKE
jgi:hypothetical protein